MCSCFIPPYAHQPHQPQRARLSWTNSTQVPLLHCLHPRSAAAPLLPEAGRPACAPGAGEGSTARGVGPGARRAGRCGKGDPSSGLTTPSVSIHARRYTHQHPGEKSSVKHRHCGFLPKASAQRPNHQPQTRGKKKENKKNPSHTQQKVLASHLHSHVLTVPQRLLQQPQTPQPADGSSSRNGVCAASHPTVPLGGSSPRVALPRPTPLCHADPRRSRRLPADAKSQQSLTSPRCLTAETCRGRLQSHRHRYELPVRSGQQATASGASHRPETGCSLAGRSSELSCQGEPGGRRDNQPYRTILWASKKTFIRRAVTSLSPSTQTCVRRFPPFAAEWLVSDSLCAGAGQDGVRPSARPSFPPKFKGCFSSAQNCGAPPARAGKESAHRHGRRTSPLLPSQQRQAVQTMCCNCNVTAAWAQ